MGGLIIGYMVLSCLGLFGKERNDVGSPENLSYIEGTNYDAWKLDIIKPGEFIKMDIAQRLEYFPRVGHLAGSTHNTQPWAFKISKELSRVDIYLDRRRVLPASDVVGRQACISVGWCIGNMILAAESLGQGLDLEVSEVRPDLIKPNEDIVNGNTEMGRYVRLASLGLGGIVGDNSELWPIYAAIVNRRMDRRRYDGRRDFDENFYSWMDSLRTDGVGLVALRRGDPRIMPISVAQAFADGFVANSGTFSKELGNWLVPSDTKSGVGMPGSTFNLAPELENEVIGGLRGEIPMRQSNLAGFSKAGADGINSAAIVGILTIENQSVQDWINVGMRLGMIANMAESLGGSLAIHAGLAEVEISRRGLGRLLGMNGIPAILFRAGISVEGKRPPHSPRQVFEDVVIK